MLVSVMQHSAASSDAEGCLYYESTPCLACSLKSDVEVDQGGVFGAGNGGCITAIPRG